MAIVKRRILATFGFNRKAIRVTQPKLHSMFCALFLKIALSLKISVTPTIQTQLTL